MKTTISEFGFNLRERLPVYPEYLSSEYIENHIYERAKKFIDNDQPLLMANSDQFIEWDSSNVLYFFTNSDCDGGIID